MPLSPSHFGGNAPPSPIFVGRTTELKILQEALEAEQMPDQYRVVSIHGVGGQGKSTLLDRFRSQFERQDNPRTPFAIVDLAIPPNRDPNLGMLKIRNHLNPFGLSSPTFDLAFSRLFKLNHPGRNLREDYPEFFGSHGSLIGDLAEIAGTVFTNLPGGKIAFDILGHLSEKYREWARRAERIVSNLDDLSPQELQENLAIYLGYDISAFIAKDPPLRPVIFFDTFEMLWQRRGGASIGIGDSIPDAWIRRLAEETPGALFIVSGRRKLNWPEVNSQWQEVIIDCTLTDLSDAEQREFLIKKGVVESEIRTRIVQTSRGHALSLNLQVRTYQKICSTGKACRVEDFPNTQVEILDRFVDHLEPSFASVLRIVAVAAELDQPLWEYLALTFQVFQLFSFSSVVADELFRHNSSNRFRLHDVLSDHLVEYLSRRDRSLLLHVRQTLFEYHSSASSVDIEQRRRVGIDKDEISWEERDSHLLLAANQLLLSEPTKLPRWCLSRLIEYQEKGIATRLRTRLLDDVKQQIGLMDAKPLLLLAELVTLEVAANPFSTISLELTDELLTVVKDADLTDDVRRVIAKISQHLLRAKIGPSLRSLYPLLAEEAGGDSRIAALEIASFLQRKDTDQLLAQVIAGCTMPSQLPEWYVLCAACSSATSALIKEVISTFLNREGHSFTVSLLKVLDTLLLRGAWERLPLILEGTSGKLEIAKTIEKIKTDNVPEGLQTSALALMAEGLLLSGNTEAALEALGDSISHQDLEGLFDLTQTWDLERISRQDALNGLEPLRLTSFFKGLRGPAHLLKVRLSVESVLHSTRPKPKFLAHLNGLAKLLETLPVVAHVHLGRYVFDVTGDNSPTQLELIVNERGEVVVFSSNPLFAWRECDFMALVGDNLFFKDERLGLCSFGIKVHEKLMHFMVSGHRALLVAMNEKDGNPFCGAYQPIYDWSKASIT